MCCTVRGARRRAWPPPNLAMSQPLPPPLRLRVVRHCGPAELEAVRPRQRAMPRIAPRLRDRSAVPPAPPPLPGRQACPPQPARKRAWRSRCWPALGAALEQLHAGFSPSAWRPAHWQEGSGNRPGRRRTGAASCSAALEGGVAVPLSGGASLVAGSIVKSVGSPGGHGVASVAAHVHSARFFGADQRQHAGHRAGGCLEEVHLQ